MKINGDVSEKFLSQLGEVLNLKNWLIALTWVNYYHNLEFGFKTNLF